MHDNRCLMGTAETAVDACTGTELEEPVEEAMPAE